MSTELAEGLMAYEIRVKGYLDWRFWQDSFGVQVSDEPGGARLRGTVRDRESLQRLFASLGYQGVRIEPPVFLTSLYSAR